MKSAHAARDLIVAKAGNEFWIRCSYGRRVQAEFRSSDRFMSLRVPKEINEPESCQPKDKENCGTNSPGTLRPNGQPSCQVKLNPFILSSSVGSHGYSSNASPSRMDLSMFQTACLAMLSYSENAGENRVS